MLPGVEYKGRAVIEKNIKNEQGRVFIPEINLLTAIAIHLGNKITHFVPRDGGVKVVDNLLVLKPSVRIAPIAPTIQPECRLLAWHDEFFQFIRNHNRYPCFVKDGPSVLCAILSDCPGSDKPCFHINHLTKGPYLHENDGPRLFSAPHLFRAPFQQHHVGENVNGQTQNLPDQTTPAAGYAAPLPAPHVGCGHPLS